MVFYLRHTQVENPQNLCYGQTSIPLAKTYPQEIEKIRAKLQGIGVTQVISSPARRCQKLGKDLFPTIPLKIDSRVWELDFGSWEQTPWSEIEKSELDHWGKDWINHAPPGGEPYSTLIERVRRFHDEYQSSKSTLVVSHSGVLRTIRCIKDNQPFSTAFNSPMEYGALIEF